MKTFAITALLLTNIAAKKYLVEVDENIRKAGVEEGGVEEAGSDYSNDLISDSGSDHGAPGKPPRSPLADCEGEVAGCAKVLVSGSSNTDINGVYELLPQRKGSSKKPQYRHVDKKGLIVWRTSFHRYEIKQLPLRFEEIVSKTGLFDKIRRTDLVISGPILQVGPRPVDPGQ